MTDILTNEEYEIYYKLKYIDNNDDIVECSFTSLAEAISTVELEYSMYNIKSFISLVSVE